MARIGMGFGVSAHRNRGWHVTGTAGTFGAAAACGKLLGFDEEKLLSAFGLAGTQSCSTWAFLSDGATNKVLHPARAAVSGLESCMLVLGGMKGSGRILDADDGGIFPMMSDGYDYACLLYTSHRVTVPEMNLCVWLYVMRWSIWNLSLKILMKINRKTEWPPAAHI